MIDHIELWLRGPDCLKVRQHPYLKFKLIVEEETGEDKCKSFAELGPMKVMELSPNMIKIHGSLHKLRSWIRDGVETNHDQFTIPELFEAIHWLTNLLDVPAQAFQIVGIEVGLNLQDPPFNVAQACQSMLYHLNKPFTTWQSGCGVVATHCKYSLKIYDKSRQGRKDNPKGRILRIERKATHMEVLRATGIKTLGDLLEVGKLKALFDWLLKPFSQIIVYDPGVKPECLGKWDTKFWNQARAIPYWCELSPKQREKKKSKLKKIIAKHSNPSLIQSILMEAAKTFEAMKIGGEFSFDQLNPLGKTGGEFASESSALEIEGRGEFAPSSIQANSTPLFHANVDEAIVQPLKSTASIPHRQFLQSHSNFDKNNFVKYLQMLFAPSTAMHLVRLYQIGTSKRWPGATVFWQVDAAGNVRAGKIIHYNAATGRLTKQHESRETWVHSMLGLPDDKIRQCLFGEHLLAQFPDKPVAIVESEKTAIICTVLMPGFVWLATGEQGNISANLFKPLRGREVTLFPDLAAFDQCKAKAVQIKGCKKLEVSDFLEKGAAIADRQEGYDLADLLVNPDPETGFALTVKGYPAFWDYRTTKVADTSGNANLGG